MDFKNTDLMKNFHYEPIDIIPIQYEDTFFKKMSDDIKSSYAEQLNEISTSLNKQLEIAKKEASDAKKEAVVSKTIAIISLVVGIAAIVIPLLVE